MATASHDIPPIPFVLCPSPDPLSGWEKAGTICYTTAVRALPTVGLSRRLGHSSWRTSITRSLSPLLFPPSFWSALS